MDRLTLPFEVKQLEQEGENFTFKGHLAAFNNIDLDRDIIEKGAFADFLVESKERGKKNVPVFWSHKSNEPIGIFPLPGMSEDSKGLLVTGQLPKDDSFVSGRVIPQIKIGSVSQMSIGYSVIDFKMKGSIRHLTKLHLWEGSLTAIPSNENAIITSFKNATPFGDLSLADRSTLWDNVSVIGRVREWAGIEEESDLQDPDVQEKYKQAFFYFDGEDPDLFRFYQLPFADIVEGKLTAIPRGIFSAAAAMRGARGGVFVPEQDRPGITRNIEKYYEKMDMETPFGKSFRIDDLTCIEERILENILKKGTRFPQNTAQAIISAIKSSGLRDVSSEGQRDVEKDSRIIESIDKILLNIKK